MAEGTPQPVWFVVLSMSRSGSWHLVELLNEHPQVVSNGELLNNDDTSGWGAGDRAGLDDGQLVERGLSNPPIRCEKSAVRAVGFKLLYEQLVDRSETLSFLAAHDEVKAIVLERRNQFEAVRSLAQARETGRWQSLFGPHEAVGPPLVQLDPRECERRLADAQLFYDSVRRVFPEERRSWVLYEDLRDDPDAVLQQLWAFLGVPCVVVQPRLQQQETRFLADCVRNFAQILDHFRGRPECVLLEPSGRRP